MNVPKSVKRSIFCASLFGLGVLCFACKVHVMQSRADGYILIPKARFSLCETFVSLDEVLDTPKAVAQSRWPLAYQSLKNEGLFTVARPARAATADEMARFSGLMKPSKKHP